ncbi:MAG: sensor histidine kinase [Vicinamibacterales bacterium]
MSAPSLKGRVWLGAVLWTAGLFVVAGIVLTQLLFRHPDAPGVFHGWFANTLPLAALSVGCLLAGLVQVRRGLESFDVLRARLGGVREGRARRLEGQFPTEVQPLIADLNGLLGEREARLARALAKAGDLAHGLKTPLALLNRQAALAEAAGQPALAAGIAQQVERMRRQVDYHLAQARASASGADASARAHVATSADALARTMRTLHANRAIGIAVDVPAPLQVRLQREDLEELLGNLVDNACKWATRQVAIGATGQGPDVLVTVDDDGPGLPAPLRASVFRRGVRADEAAPGSGLGLAIVRDLVDVYGGAVALTDSPSGGLRAELRLPAAPPAH